MVGWQKRKERPRNSTFCVGRCKIEEKYELGLNNDQQMTTTVIKEAGNCPLIVLITRTGQCPASLEERVFDAVAPTLVPMG
jgi:hypothetical protein